MNTLIIITSIIIYLIGYHTAVKLFYSNKYNGLSDFGIYVVSLIWPLTAIIALIVGLLFMFYEYVIIKPSNYLVNILIDKESGNSNEQN